MAPVVAPKGKDLFDQWTEDDWQNVDKQKDEVFSKFTETLEQTSKMLAQNTAVISSIESKNEKLFQERKKAQEEADSFLKDIAMAFVTGGMAGVKSALRGKVEDKINMELAKAFIQATGGSPDQVQLFSDAMGFMRGKVQERNIKKRANTISISNPIRSLENLGSKYVAAISSIPIVGNVYQMVTAAHLAVARVVMGPKAYDGMMNKATGAKRQLAEIKANEKSLTKSYATRAVAHTTGLPAEVVGQMITDYQGAKAARKTRRAIEANPVMNAYSQVVGVIGGIVKTAAVAFGAKERDMQRFLNDANSLQFAGTTNYQAAEIQNNAYTNQMLGMKAQGTSYTSSTPTLKNKKGFVEELGKRALIEEVAKAGGWDKDIVDAAIRGELGRREQKKADKKAQADAARSTLTTAVMTAVSFGALAALGPIGSAIQTGINAVGNVVSAGINAVGGFVSSLAPALGNIATSVGSFLNVGATAAFDVGAAAIKTAVQVIDGSRNGMEGALAGFANGVLGSLTSGLNPLTKLGDGMGSLLKDSVVGLGVSYDKQNGWGGMIGIGNGANNLAVSFSQRGNTSIDGSVGLSKDKASWLSNVQLTASHQTNGSTTIGANFNEGKGDRDGWNYGLNYDLNGGGPSASIGYTNPGSKLGFTSTIDRNGLSTSAEHLGTSIATMTQDGVQMDEINWMQQNINAAQDATETLQGNVETLKERGYSEEQIRNMTPDQHDELANKIRIENDNNALVANGLDPDTMTPEQRNQALYNLQPDAASPIPALLGAFGSVGGFLAGALGLSIGNGTSSSPTSPANNANAEPLVGRRREDEEGGEVTERDGKIDGDKPPIPDLLNNPIALAIPDAPSEPERRPDAIVLSPNMQEALDLVGDKPRVLTDNDGNPLYFAQATTDGSPKTDGSGNVKERGPANVNSDVILNELESKTKLLKSRIDQEKLNYDKLIDQRKVFGEPTGSLDLIKRFRILLLENELLKTKENLDSIKNQHKKNVDSYLENFSTYSTFGENKIAFSETMRNPFSGETTPGKLDLFSKFGKPGYPSGKEHSGIDMAKDSSTQTYSILAGSNIRSTSGGVPYTYTSYNKDTGDLSIINNKDSTQSRVISINDLKKGFLDNLNRDNENNDKLYKKFTGMDSKDLLRDKEFGKYISKVVNDYESKYPRGGNSISILSNINGREYRMSYLHFVEKPNLTNVRSGKIEPGISIGKVGTTGNSSGNHLHITVTPILNKNEKMEDFLKSINYKKDIDYELKNKVIDPIFFFNQIVRRQELLNEIQ